MRTSEKRAASCVRVMRKAGLAGLFAATSLTAPNLAFAQDAAAPQASVLEEVVVTARRREELLQDVPISVVAVSQEQLNQKNVKTANDLVVVAPGLSIQNTTGNRNTTTYSIRGQGQTFGQVAPGVVPYFAEVPNFSSQIFDLQSVQVLKGPQGTLFGKNTTGGAILFVPVMPTDHFQGYAVGRIGDHDRRDFEFGVGGPIFGDKAMFRIAGQYLSREGYTRDLTSGEDYDDEDRYGYRAILTLRPLDGLENVTIYEKDKVDEGGSGQVVSYIAPNFNNAPVLSQLQAYLAAQQARGIRDIATTPGWPAYIRLSNSGWINATTWDVNDYITLKNIYSERRTKGGQSYDIDSTPLPLLQVTNPDDVSTKTITEEFQVQGRLGPVSGVVGYYYEDSDTPLHVGFDTNQFFSAAVLGALAPPLATLFPDGAVLRAISYGSSSGRSQAFFGQLDWNVTDSLTLTGGVRRTEDERGSFSQTFTLLPGQPVPGGPTIPVIQQEVSFEATTWNVAASYEVNRNLNVYATVRRGYKAGGLNSSAINPADRLFDPEFLTDYEVGVKGRYAFGDWRTRFAVDVFYDDYTDIQRFINLPTTPASTITRNAAAGNITGLDVDVTVAPSDWFDVSLVYTFMDAEYDTYMDPVQGDLSESRFPNTPKHQLTLTPVVHFPAPDGLGRFSAMANIYYQSSMALDPANVPNGNPAVTASALGANIDGYTRVDLRLDWREAMGSPVSVAAYLRNAFDEEYVVGSNNQLSTLFGFGSLTYGQPRMFGIELRYEFGQ